MERDLTTGSVFKTVIYFSLPYLLSYFLQTLYGMADLFIVGQFGGVSSTTAVSIGSQIMHMLTVMIVGLAMGATVMIGRCIGAKDYKKAAETIGNTATMFMGIAIILMIILLAAVRPIVSVMSTPAEAVEGTIRYLTICFIGIPFITAYNIISAIFRGIGDSKSPMYFIAVACAANIGLDVAWNGPQEVLCDRVAALQRFFLTHDRTSVYAIDGTAVDEVVLHPVGFLAATAQGALAAVHSAQPDAEHNAVNGCVCCGIRRCEPARVVTMTISSMLSPCWR